MMKSDFVSKLKQMSVFQDNANNNKKKNNNKNTQKKTVYKIYRKKPQKKKILNAKQIVKTNKR